MVKRFSHTLLQVALTLAGIIGLSAAVHAQEWTAKEQPDLKQQLDAAAPLKEVDLGVPIYTVQTNRMWAPNPDGKTHDCIIWYFPSYGGPFTGVTLDLASGRVGEVQMLPKRQARGGTAVAPDGKLYTSTNDGRGGGMEIYVYDPAKNEWSSLGVVAPEVSGELGTAVPLTLGMDGNIYGAGSNGTEKRAGAYQINTKTGKTTDYGLIGPSHAPNGAYGYWVAADDRYVYVASGKIPWYLVAYDRETGKDEVLLTTARTGEDLRVFQGRFGCTATVTKDLGDAPAGGEQQSAAPVEYWLYQGKVIPKKSADEAPPWPEPKDAKPLVNMPKQPERRDDWLQPDRNGNAFFAYHYAGDAPLHAAAGDTAAMSPDARLEAEGWKVIRFKAPIYPNQKTTLVRELPDGRILGKSDPYQGSFAYDPATKELKHLGRYHISQYSQAIVDGKVYMAGYPRVVFIVYDPAKPWDTVGEDNPRSLGQLGPYSGIHHPFAAAAGADKKVYVGGSWYRNGECGGLSWYDTTTGKAGGLREPFGNYKVLYMTTAENGRYIVISTRAVYDAPHDKAKPEQAKLFVFDTTAGSLAREFEPFAKVGCTGPIAGVGGSRVIGMCADPDDSKATILYGVDIAAAKVCFTKRIPYVLDDRVFPDKFENGRFDFRLGPDGKVWSFFGNTLVRINPGDATVEVLGKARAGGTIAFSGKDVYLSGTEQLRQVPGLVATAPAP